MAVALTAAPQMTCVFGMPPDRATLDLQEDARAW